MTRRVNCSRSVECGVKIGGRYAAEGTLGSDTARASRSANAGVWTVADGFIPPPPSDAVLGYASRMRFRIPILRDRVGDQPEQGKRSPLAVDRGTGGPGTCIAAAAASAFPDPKPYEFQPGDRALGEMELGVRKFPGRIGVVVREDLTVHMTGAFQPPDVAAWSPYPCVRPATSAMAPRHANDRRPQSATPV